VFSPSVTRLTPDPTLAIQPALHPERMFPWLAQAIGLRPDERDALSCDAEVLSHKLGQRCTIRYTLRGHAESSRTKLPVTLIGKLYAKRPMAGRLYRRLEALGRGPFESGASLRVPRPLLVVRDLGLVVLDHFPGADLREVLHDGGAYEALTLAGRWLARLHAAVPLAGLRSASPDHELGKVQRWCDLIGSALTGADAGRLDLALKSMGDLTGRLKFEPVMIHKDFYFGNVLWDGERVCVLDFDELAVGDPALDLGHFLAHLEVFAYRIEGRVNGLSAAAMTFSKAYATTDQTLALRVTFYRAYTFLKLAATEAARKPDGWDRMAQKLAGLACRELEQAVCE